MREIFSKIVNIVPVEVEVVGHDDGADHADGLQQLIAPAPGALGQQHARDDGALDIVQCTVQTLTSHRRQTVQLVPQIDPSGKLYNHGEGPY